MNILLLGSGGREHALAWKIAQSPKVEKLYIAPGNAGTKEVGENVNIAVCDFDAIAEFVLANNVSMVVVGPEDPLVKGVYDYFAADERLKEVAVIGPTKAAAELEGSKNFAKEKVSHITLDKDIMHNEYKVIFASGTKLEFNGDGEWREIDCRYSAVPHNLAPEKIAEHIKTHYPNSKITELKRKHSGWEVKITGGHELKFNNDCCLVEIDD